MEATVEWSQRSTTRCYGQFWVRQTPQRGPIGCPSCTDTSTEESVVQPWQPTTTDNLLTADADWPAGVGKATVAVEEGSRVCGVGNAWRQEATYAR